MVKATVWLRNPETYAQCAWVSCHNDCTDRYPLPFCQEHLLLMWSYVDEDMRAANRTPDDVENERAEIVEAKIQRNHETAHVEYAKRPKRGLIYYLQIGEYIKIGYTSNPKRRGSEYPPGSKLLLSYPGSHEDEKRLHEKFSAYREAGREWYMDAAEIREHIEELRAQHGQFEAGLERRTRHRPGRVQMRKRSGSRGQR